MCGGKLSMNFKFFEGLCDVVFSCSSTKFLALRQCGSSHQRSTQLKEIDQGACDVQSLRVLGYPSVACQFQWPELGHPRLSCFAGKDGSMSIASPILSPSPLISHADQSAWEGTDPAMANSFANHLPPPIDHRHTVWLAQFT